MKLPILAINSGPQRLGFADARCEASCPRAEERLVRHRQHRSKAARRAKARRKLGRAAPISAAPE
jgi:hypothetical protein